MVALKSYAIVVSNRLIKEAIMATLKDVAKLAL